jgi:glycosyltransferase involved in cell wall biosynthesis
MKKEKPKISVIMAAYNSEKFIKSSIESILNQTLQDFELIVINDFSKDKTEKIVKNIQKVDSRIVLINNKKNSGPAISRNNGLKKARGKYIAILDSDDLSMSKRLEIEYNYLEKNKDIFLVGSSAIFIDENNNIISKYPKYNHPEILMWRMPKSCSIIHSSVMYRNERFFYDENFPCAQDYKFYLDLIKNGKKITNLPYYLIKYRISPNSISNLKKQNQIKLRNKLKKDYAYLSNRVSNYKKLLFYVFLVYFYLKTFFMKRGIFIKNVQK